MSNTIACMFRCKEITRAGYNVILRKQSFLELVMILTVILYLALDLVFWEKLHINRMDANYEHRGQIMDLRNKIRKTINYAPRLQLVIISQKFQQERLPILF